MVKPNLKYSLSPCSPGIHLKRIDIPQSIVTYYQQRGLFVRGLPGYEQIEGKESTVEQTIADKSQELGELHTYPVENSRKEDQLKAEEESRDLIACFTRGNPRHITQVKRDYMILGNTLPIKVQAYQDKTYKTVLFVKKPNIFRIFGASFYNILSGNLPMQDFIFNCYSFVEREIEGQHLDTANKKAIEQKTLFKESSVRLALLDDFIFINDLARTVGPKKCMDNIIIKYDGTLMAFDFEKLFENPFKYLQRITLLEVLRDKGLDVSIKFEKQTRQEEARKILSRMERNKHTLGGLCKLLNHSPEMVDRFQQGGFKSAEAFFKDRVRYLFTQTK